MGEYCPARAVRGEAGVFEVLYQLLGQLGLGAATRPLCELITDLEGESMTVRQLQQEIRSVLRRHGVADRSEVVIAALVELGFAGLSEAQVARNEDTGEAAQPGVSPRGDSKMLRSGESSDIIATPRASTDAIHEIARDWLDIDSGIYVDVRQHDAGSDSE
jgi:hypothetical protein